MPFVSATQYAVCWSSTSNRFKGRHGRDEFTKLLFESVYKFRVLLDVNVSLEVVVTRKSNTTRNFSCTVLQFPVVLTSLKASLISTTVSVLNNHSRGIPVVSGCPVRLNRTKLAVVNWRGGLLCTTGSCPGRIKQDSDAMQMKKPVAPYGII